MGRNIFRILRTSLMIFLLSVGVFGVVYPLVLTGLASFVFPVSAQGSFLVWRGICVGSQLVGQKFSKPEYFWGRPSSVDYAMRPLEGQGFFANKQETIQSTRHTLLKYFKESDLDTRWRGTVPGGLITYSASGVDPHISIGAALFQIPRIAFARQKEAESLRRLVFKHVESPVVRFWGPAYVNVLTLNLALEADEDFQP